MSPSRGALRNGGIFRAGDEAQLAVVAEADAAVTPPAVAEHPLRDGEGVEELVGDDDSRRGRACGLEVPTPADRHIQAGEARALHGFQRRVALDELHIERGAKSRIGTRGPQRIAHQRATPWPQLDEPQGSGRAHPLPDTAHHSPISSPNTWLISGAVMKSPPRPMAHALAVVAVLGIVEARAACSRRRRSARRARSAPRALPPSGVVASRLSRGHPSVARARQVDDEEAGSSMGIE